MNVCLEAITVMITPFAQIQSVHLNVIVVRVFLEVEQWTTVTVSKI